MNEIEPLCDARTHVYTRRWAVLGVICYGAFLQAAVWNTWGPISYSAEALFSWDTSMIGQLSMWGAVPYIITVLPLSWLIDVKGKHYSWNLSMCSLNGSQLIQATTGHFMGRLPLHLLNRTQHVNVYICIYLSYSFILYLCFIIVTMPPATQCHVQYNM
jgi:hypothetical protein